MTDEELDAIEERVLHRWRTPSPDSVVAEAVGQLLAEIRRLRAELAQK